MSNQSLSLTPALYEYILQVSLRESPVLAALRAETARMPQANMQIAPEQGQFMQLLVSLCGARRIIEVGVFTGYSSLAMAQALPDDGEILACDVSEEFTDVARRYWQRAGVDARIDLRIGPAGDTLAALLAQGQSASWDFAFIDADKTGYAGYYEQCLELLRPGGLIALDNTLWGGSVVDAQRNDDDTRAIRALNLSLLEDTRIDLSMVPIGDGLTLARKR
ncbi:MAG: class I SAM-dependent methyltransferase [Gammaproteobacteria bacterium]|nr:class I SAM-dependent methyltransferase [Gammaproteobacteria bacterium]